ncbi:MAG: SAM-dependent methyltransferase [Anaerolineae bacterium]|nr:SAM-dependent methyltransferase [Anaerolineae bacterium]
MEQDQSWIPPGVDMSRPNPARMYDYYLGGYHNFEVDRQAAEQVLHVLPQSRALARANRAYVRRVVDFMLDEGIRQFMDVGAGIPTVGHIHQRAKERRLPVHVVYIDRDSIAVAHAKMLLGGNHDAAALHADARRPQDILQHPETRRLIDFSQPVGLICIAVLPFILDDAEVFSLLREFYALLVPGSYVCLSHNSEDYASDELRRVVEMYKDSSDPARLRPIATIDRFFDGLELVEPGMTLAPLWRTDATMDDIAELGGFSDYTGVARVPERG